MSTSDMSTSDMSTAVPTTRLCDRQTLTRKDFQ